MKHQNVPDLNLSMIGEKQKPSNNEFTLMFSMWGTDLSVFNRLSSFKDSWSSRNRKIKTQNPFLALKIAKPTAIIPSNTQFSDDRNRSSWNTNIPGYLFISTRRARRLFLSRKYVLLGNIGPFFALLSILLGWVHGTHNTDAFYHAGPGSGLQRHAIGQFEDTRGRDWAIILSITTQGRVDDSKATLTMNREVGLKCARAGKSHLTILS